MKSSNVTNPALARMLDLCHAKIPDFEVRFKAESRLMHFLNFFVQIFNRKFMSDYTTVIGPVVYFPSRERFLREQDMYASVLAHELVHMLDMQRLGTVRFTVMYMFPQILAPLALLAIGAFWEPWFLLALLFLLFIAPIPAPWRRDLELRGYVMSLAVQYWKTRMITSHTIDWAASQFIGPSYYFMWPFRSHTVQELKLAAVDIRTGHILRTDPLFVEVRAAFVE
jgi:hypothetical protein